MKVLLGIKTGMTRVFDGDKSVPVTILDTNGAVVSYSDDQGYEIGIGKLKKVGKALEGKYKTLGFVPRYRVWVSGNNEMVVGDPVSIDEVDKGLKVDVTGQSKGKGFAGVVKRWGFAGGPKTHGQSDRLRAPGSIGAGTDPGRVLKGKKMAGRMGGQKTTVKNKKIVDKTDGYLLISGAVPGSRGDVVTVTIME